MLKRIHVNQHVIRANKKNGTSEPPLTIKTYAGNTLARSASIVDGEGKVVARVIYSPEKPLDCGAHVWIETELEVQADGASGMK